MISPTGRPSAQRAAQLGVEALLEAAAVEAPGERIRARHARERVAAAILVAGVPAAQHGQRSQGRAQRTRRTPDPGARRPRPPPRRRCSRGRDRDHGSEWVRERREHDRHEEQQRERARRASVGRHHDRREGDLGDAPKQEERLAPAAAHHALVRDQDEQQRHDRARCRTARRSDGGRARPRWRPRRASPRRMITSVGARPRRCSRHGSGPRRNRWDRGRVPPPYARYRPGVRTLY